MRVMLSVEHMNFTARVMSFAKGDGVIVSNRVKHDVMHRGETWIRNLQWTEFQGVIIKEFSRTRDSLGRRIGDLITTSVGLAWHCQQPDQMWWAVSNLAIS